MITFKKTKDSSNKFDTSTITLESEAVSLPEILEDFKSFLMACGYAVEYTDDIVIEKEESFEEEE